MAGASRRRCAVALGLVSLILSACTLTKSAKPKTLVYLQGEADSIGARVYIDGRFEGIMLANGDDIPTLDLKLDAGPGHHTLKVVSKKGQVFSRKLSAEAGEQYPDVDYDIAVAYLEGSDALTGADVYVDGELEGAMRSKRGVASMYLEQDPGFHDLRLVSKEGRTLSRRILLKAGENYVDLDTDK